MKGGLQLIIDEREDQVEKHNYSVIKDLVENSNGELTTVATILIGSIGGLPFPPSWYAKKADLCEKLINKPRKEKLAIAGALLAAEIDRMQKLEEDGILTRGPGLAPKGPPPPLPPIFGEDRIKRIKGFRLDIDKLLNTSKMLDRSREVSLFLTNLQFAFAWLGESLKSLGSSSPYVNSETPSNTIIEPTADHTDSNVFGAEFTDLPGQTERIKFLRSILSEYMSAFNDFEGRIYSSFLKNPETVNNEFSICLLQSRFAIVQAKFSLGWELGRIRDSKA